MNLHILHPEKFAGHITSIFEAACPGENLYILSNTNWCSYIESKKQVEKYKDIVYYAQDIYSGSRSIDFSKIDRVFVHYLDPEKIRLINDFGLDNRIIIWLVWGGDLYNQLLYPNGYKMYAYWPGAPFANPSRLKWVIKYRSILNRFLKKDSAIKIVLRFIKSHNLIAAGSQADYELARKWFPAAFKKVKFMPFFYLPIEIILPEQIRGKWSEGNYVFVGHSASPTGNHKVSLKKLGKINLGERKLVLPISYNCNKENGPKIKHWANTYCGDKCLFLEDYMPLQEYNSLMLQADRYIYCNYRQEAFNNIIVALYLGAKVYLSKNSTLRKDFDRLGIIYGLTEHINQKEFDKELTIEQKKQNRKLLLEYLSKKRQYNLLNNLIQL